jgi:hypothetical protein
MSRSTGIEHNFPKAVVQADSENCETDGRHARDVVREGTRRRTEPAFNIKGMFQNLLQRVRLRPVAKPRDAMDGIVKFLSMPFYGPRTTIENFVELAGPALGGVAYYFSVPFAAGSDDSMDIDDADGDGLVKANQQSKTRRFVSADLKLVAHSQGDEAKIQAGSKPPEEFAAVINAALQGVAPQDEDEERYLVATITGYVDDVLGVFLMVGVPSMSQDLFLDMLSATQAWATVLNGRLDRVRQLALLREHDRKAKLYAVGAKMAQQPTIRGMLEKIQGPMRDVMNVEMITVWFYDEAHEEAWTVSNTQAAKGVSVKIDVGLLGDVARRARQTKDFHKSVVITNSPQSCPLWKRDDACIPCYCEVEVQCLLSAPILANTDRKLLGIVQIANKRSKTDLEDSFVFSESDVRLLEVCAAICADELVRLTVDQIAIKADIDNLDHSKKRESIAIDQGSVASILNEYYQSSFMTVGRDSRRASVTDSIHEMCDSEEAFTDEDSSRRQSLLENTLSPNDSLELIPKRPSVLRTQSGHPDIDVDHWRVDYWSLTIADEFLLFTQALARCHLQAPEEISAFFRKVKTSYNDLPYHNFQHAISAMHYSYKLVQAASLVQYLEKSDLFALIVGALCHDIGHRGYNSAFEVTTRSELALRYNDCSPLENHHCAQTFEIALSSGGHCNIFKDMSAEFYTHVRKVMVASILGTDMKHHGDHVKTAKEFDPTTDERGDRAIVISGLVMHAADIANPFMPPDISRRWGDVLCQEFTKQVEAERQLSLPVTPFMDGLTNPVAKAKSGIGFTDFVVFPMVDPLFRIFDGWAEPKGWQLENRQALAAIVADAEEQETKVAMAEEENAPSGVEQTENSEHAD